MNFVVIDLNTFKQYGSYQNLDYAEARLNLLTEVTAQSYSHPLFVIDVIKDKVKS